MNAKVIRNLILAVIVGLLACGTSRAATSVDSSGVLKLLHSKSAASVVAQYPSQSRELALDLIVYRWACQRYGVNPGLPNLDDTISALVSASADETVQWAVYRFGGKEWSGKAGSAKIDDAVTKSLIDAQQSVDAAVASRDNYPTRSIEYLKTCVSILDSLHLELSVAFVTDRIAERQLNIVRRYREARANYERAYPVFRAYGMRAKVAEIFDSLGNLEMKVGRYFIAHLNYGASSTEWQAAGRSDLGAKELMDAGIALMSDGATTTALAKMSSALTLCRDYASPKNGYYTLVQLLMQAAVHFSSAGEKEKHNKLLDEAVKTARKEDDPFLLAGALGVQVGALKVAKLNADAQEAEREKILAGVYTDGSAAAAKLANRSIPATEQNQLVSLVRRGAMAAVQIGKHKEALDLLNSLIIVFQAQSNQDEEIATLRLIAAEYDAIGDRNASLNTRVKAAAMANSMDKQLVAVAILRDIERNALGEKDTSSAAAALYEAAKVVNASENRLALADVQESRGLLLAKLGQNGDAEPCLKESADIYSSELGEPWTPASVLENLADVQIKLNKSSEAMVSLTHAIEMVEKFAEDQYVDLNAGIQQQNTMHRMYSSIINLLIRQGLKEDAIVRLSAASGYKWYDRLRAELRAGGNPLALQVLQSTDGATRSLERTYPDQVRKIASSWQSVITNVPQFSFVARGGGEYDIVAPIDAAEIFRNRNKLPQGLAVVEYVLSKNGVYVLAATNKSASCWELPVDDEKVLATIRSFKTEIRDAEGRISSGIPLPPVKSWTDTPSLTRIVTPLFDLGQMLFEPIRADLAAWKVKSIAFVLPDKMRGMPFHAIARDIKGSYRFLIQDYAVTYVSPGMFGSLVSGRQPALNPATCKVGVFYDSSGDLPGAAKEKEIIRGIYKNCSINSGELATAGRFVSVASSSNIIHIAAHHKADPNPAKFSITLSKLSGGKGVVQLLDVLRIENRDLQLAVLSGCDTISTSDTDVFAAAYGADVLGIAGFPSVIGGLWKISDQASVFAMSVFYKNLGTMGRAEALRSAQRALIESGDRKYTNPYYWASLVLYGDPR